MPSREEHLQLQARYVSRLEYEILQAREETRAQEKALTDQAREAKTLRERLASLAAEKAAAMDRVAQIEASRLWRLFTALRSLARALRGLGGPPIEGSADATTAMSLFDEDYYRRSYPEAGAANGLADYLSAGWKAGRNPHPLFDTTYYLQSNPDVAASGVNPLVHYLKLGGFEGRNPHPLFLSKWYLDANPDVAASGMNPLYHFLRYGGLDGRDPHPWFDSSFYLQRYPDAASAQINPLVHFVTIGAAELRDPNDQFVTAFYVETNPDAAAASTNPLVHYLEIGRSAGRASRPPDAKQLSSSIGPIAKDRRDSEAAYKRVMRLGRDRELVRLRAVAVNMGNPDSVKPTTADGGGLTFGETAAPLVSIVVLASPKADQTVQCLTSIQETTRTAPYEVVLADDGSAETGEAIDRIRGVVRSSQGGGGGRGYAWNRGADLARGRYLVFLDAEVQLTPEWLPPLLTELDDQRIGAVGPKVVFPDGRLQEAGVAINGDGTFVLIGANDDPELPRYNYARDVESVSGACVAIEAGRFRELGGFSTDVARGNECIDLCLRIAERGMRVVYDPRATVTRAIAPTSSSTAIICQSAKDV